MRMNGNSVCVFVLLAAVMPIIGCSGFGEEGMKALANKLEESSKNLVKATAAIDPAGINKLLDEAEKLRKQRDDAERRAKEASDVIAGLIPLAIVGAYKNPVTGKPTRVDHIEGSRFTFISGDGSKEMLLYDVNRRAFVRASGRTAAFFFPETRTIAFDGEYWKP